MKQLARHCSQEQVQRLDSSLTEAESHALGNTEPLCDGDRQECSRLLHDLNTVLGGMLVNAQVMQWKLPTYSHCKRYLREIERSAQRGGSLLNQLMRRLGALEEDRERVSGEAPDLTGAMVAVTAQESNSGAGMAATMPRSGTVHAAPVFSRGAIRNTHILL